MSADRLTPDRASAAGGWAAARSPESVRLVRHLLPLPYSLADASVVTQALEAWIAMETYFGYADAVESLGTTTQVRFDAIRTDDLSLLRRVGGFQQAAQGIRTRLFELSVTRRGVGTFPGLAQRRIEADRWYRLSIGPKGHAALSFGTPYAAEGEPTRIEDIAFLDARREPARSLSRLVSLDDLPDGQEAGIRKILTRPLLKSTFVAVYNVGQGSCSAICAEPNFPIVYFDFGGGVTQNASTYPAGLQFCFTQKPPVILSHWDLDHWVSGQRHSEALDLKWIVPRQRMGPTHRKFAAELHQRGNLVIWPAGVASISTSIGQLLKLPSHRNRNYSGIVLIATLGDDLARVLCPGDAPYHRIPADVLTNLHGLVATHHGGNYRADIPPPANGIGAVAYSFGLNNSYGHPRPVAIRKHVASGWTHRRDTPQGNTALPPAQVLPFPPACRGTQCSLTIQQ